MPRDHNQLDYATRIQRGIRLASGLSESEQGVTRLGETWQPILDPHRRPEWNHLIGERPCIGFQTQAATVGEFSAVGLRNPANSQVLVVVEAHSPVNNTANSQCALRTRAISATGLVSTNTPFSRDSRNIGFGGNGGVALITTLSHATEASLGNGPVWNQMVGNTVGTYLPIPIVISPGFEILWNNRASNQPLLCSFWWREIRLMPGQL